VSTVEVVHPRRGVGGRAEGTSVPSRNAGNLPPIHIETGWTRNDVVVFVSRAEEVAMGGVGIEKAIEK
jgi:hypothetical protein